MSILLTLVALSLGDVESLPRSLSESLPYETRAAEPAPRITRALGRWDPGLATC